MASVGGRGAPFGGGVMRARAPHFWQRLSGKAMLLLGGLVLLAGIEVSLAIYFRSEIERNFGVEREIERTEMSYVVAITQVLAVLDDVNLNNSGHEMAARLSLSRWRDQVNRLRPTLGDLLRLRVALDDAPRLEDVLVRIDGILDRQAVTESDLRFVAAILHEGLLYYSNLLHVRLGEIKQEKIGLTNRHAARRDQFAAVLIGLGLIGLLAIAVSGGVFLTRLNAVLEKLRGRAHQITTGDYGPPLDIRRSDEVGDLVASVDAMAQALQERERQIEDLRLRFSQQEKMLALGTFASGMAHEIGNPIQAILALASQIVESLLEDQSRVNILENADRVGIISAQAERLAKTVSEIREFLRQGAARTEYVDLNEAVHTTVRLMRFDPRFADIRLDTDLDENLPAVRAVADHLSQVVMNLLINAADAVELKEGRILVSTRATADGGVAIAVQDNGAGMSDDVRRRALEPFYTTKPKGKGTGLGLAICRTIVEEHGGRLSIDSAPGKGTLVTIIIPGARMP